MPQSQRYCGGRAGCRQAVFLEILWRKNRLQRGRSYYGGRAGCRLGVVTMEEERAVERPQSQRYCGERAGCRETVVLEILWRKSGLWRGRSLRDIVEEEQGNSSRDTVYVDPNCFCLLFKFMVIHQLEYIYGPQSLINFNFPFCCAALNLFSERNCGCFCRLQWI